MIPVEASSHVGYIVAIVVALITMTGGIITTIVKVGGNTNAEINKIDKKLDVHIAETASVQNILDAARKGFEVRCEKHTTVCEEDRKNLHIGLERLAAKVHGNGAISRIAQ